MNSQNKTVGAHATIFAANVIFGLGVPVTKFLLDQWVTPMTYMASRCLGAALIFWIVSLFLPKEHVERKDLIVIMAGGLLGFVISQTLTAWALVYTTPVYFSLIATMLLAIVFLGERATSSKTLGVILAIAGAALMVFVGWQSGTGSNDLLGITLALLSLLTWAVYLIITRKVSQKYTAVTQMKWIFLISSIAVLPFAWNEFPQTALYGGQCAWDGALAMLFIIVFATVLGFFAIPYAMQYLRATTVSVYTNLQPVAAILVLLGAWFVTKNNG